MSFYGRLLLSWFFMLSVAHAESQPKHLDTNFDVFKQLQQQHDNQLGTATRPSTTPNDSSTKATSTRARHTSKSKSNVADASVSINRADATTLSQQLIGVGPKKAAAIVEYRTAHGPFQRVDDLTLVKGIGPATLEKNRQRIVVD